MEGENQENPNSENAFEGVDAENAETLQTTTLEKIESNEKLTPPDDDNNNITSKSEDKEKDEDENKDEDEDEDNEEVEVFKTPTAPSNCSSSSRLQRTDTPLLISATESPSTLSASTKRKLISEFEAQKKRKLEDIDSDEEIPIPPQLTKTESMTYPTAPISFDDIWVTQNIVRKSDLIHSLIKSLRLGVKLPYLLIFSFPDGKNYLHDGHHRALAYYLSGRDKLYEDEYVVIHSTYETMSKPIFSKYFVTPYDPRVEIRLGEFGDFKKKALELSQQSEEKAEEFIRDNRHLYACKRNVTTIESLVKEMGLSRSDFADCHHDNNGNNNNNGGDEHQHAEILREIVN